MEKMAHMALHEQQHTHMCIAHCTAMKPRLSPLPCSHPVSVLASRPRRALPEKHCADLQGRAPLVLEDVQADAA